MIKKMLLILLVLFINGCSFHAGIVRGQEYSYLDDQEMIREIQLENFWEKITGEMHPISIWGDANTDHVGPCIGKFEGMGYSVNGKIPNTCVPRRKMRLTGDATARDGNRVARVRSWR